MQGEDREVVFISDKIHAIILFLDDIIIQEKYHMKDIEKLQPETMESQKHKSAIILNIMERSAELLRGRFPDCCEAGSQVTYTVKDLKKAREDLKTIHNDTFKEYGIVKSTYEPGEKNEDSFITKTVVGLVNYNVHLFETKFLDYIDPHAL